jgi:asparagine synthase (glutamine-hydrolysing)
MYSFALYDKNLDQLIISRDEFGIKPIYFSTMMEGFFFSSELNALKMIIPEKKKIDDKKVIEHLKFQYCSGNRTIFKGINRLRPGESLIIKNGKIIRSIFKKLLPKKNIICTEKFIKTKILDSVSSHLRSDVPYCLFFSGGIDSMLLLYSIKALGIKNTKAYTINFVENKQKQSLNLENICKENNIKLHIENFSEDDFWNSIFFAAENIDEPLADYAILPTFKLAKEASKEFKVAITGEGGDELFGGYGRYKKAKRILFSKTINKGLFSSNKLFINYSNFKPEHYDKQKYFDFDNLTKIQSSQIFDYKNWLPNNLLVKLDRCLMTYGMEGRTPFIDKDLFNSLFYMNDNDKVRNGFGKYYIRNLLSNKIINYDAFAPKQGFTVPIYEWIPKKINLIEKYLLKLKFLSPFFSREQLSYLCQNIKKNKKIVKSIWHIIFFSSWYLIHVEGLKNRGNYFEVMKKVNG